MPLKFSTMKYVLFLTSFIAIIKFLPAQDTTLLIAGPMLGYIEHTEALIWLQVTPRVKEIEIRYWKNTDPSDKKSLKYNGKLGESFNPEKLVLRNLEMNTTYSYAIILNGKVQKFPYPVSFNTKIIWQHRMAAPDFTFIFGSCNYINDYLHDRPGVPYGRDYRIFDSMANTNADFMLWTGDNIYLREADWTSESGIYYRNTYTRKCRNLQRLLTSHPNYAIWDDHDYGPNNANKSFELKNVTLQAFKEFWGNQTYGEQDNPGIYGKFSWSDCDFFLLDDRFYRSDEDLNDSIAKTFLGDKQMEWLKNALLSSKATFKFIASGSQVLNPINDFECYRHYEREFNELMMFLRDQKITGVLFLSGDRHFSEIIKEEMEGMYPLHDITSSALTSGTFAKFSETKEFQNPYRAVANAVTEQNYIKVSIAGEKKNRIATIKAITIDNKTAWEYQIKATELKF